MLSEDKIKQKVGEYAAQLVQTNTIIGIGTGSTVYYFIHALAARVKQGLQIKGVPTSKQTTLLAKKLGIELININESDTIQLTIDGADEIDLQLQLIKGGGGALLQEKIVAASSQQLIIIAESSKLVKRLGKFPLPVEVISYGWKKTRNHIEELHCKNITLRMNDEKPFKTDHGHYILDCNFNQVDDAKALHTQLNNIPGVVENGLFINMANAVVIGDADGNTRTIKL
jgi:ribose 5-phosphate isomerase A